MIKKLKLPILYSQWDSRWGSTLLGNNTSSVYNIYNYGCLLSDLAMCCEYFGHPETPLTLNTTLKKKDIGGFTTGGGDYQWGSLTKIYKEMTETVVTTPLPLTDKQMNDIKNSIDAGFPVIANIDVNPKTVVNDMHFVTIIGYDSDDENNLIIADPLGGKERSLKDYLGWYKPSVRKTIEKYCIVKGKVPSLCHDSEIDRDDGEGKRKKWGWYLYEWYVEKKNAIKAVEALEKSKELFEAKIDKIISDNNAILKSKEEAHAKEIKELRAGFNTQASTLIEQHKLELKSLESDYKAQLIVKKTECDAEIKRVLDSQEYKLGEAIYLAFKSIFKGVSTNDK